MAAILVGVGAFLVAITEFILGITAGQWQLFVSGAMTAVIAAEGLIAFRLARSGRATLGLGIVFLTSPLVFIVHAGMMAGIGLPLAMGIMAILVTGPPILMPTRYIGRLLFYGTLAGILVLLTDRYAGAWRISPPDYLQWLIVGVVASIMLLNLVLLLRQFSHLALSTKLTQIMVIVSLASAGAVAAVSVQNTRQSLEEVNEGSLKAAASQAAAAVDHYLNSNMVVIERESQLSAFVSLLALPAAQRTSEQIQEAEKQLVELSQKEVVLDFTSADQFGSIQALLLLDTAGKVILSTQASENGADYSERDYFSRAIYSRVPYVSAVEFTPTNQALLTFSARVLSQGQVVGVLAMRADATVLQSILERNTGLAGSGSYGILLDENRMLLGQGNRAAELFTMIVPLPASTAASLTSDRRIPVRLPSERSTNLVELEQGLDASDQSPTFAYTVLETGESGGGFGSRYLAAVSRVQTRPWQMVYTQTEEAVTAPIENQTRNIQLLALIAASLAALVAIWLANLLSVPLLRLTQAAGQVMAGELSARATIFSEDETGEMAKAFNSMTERLQSLIAGLEDRISERTSELERRSRFLEASAQVSQATASMLDPEGLTRQVVDLVRERFDLYYVGLFLVDEGREWAVLRAATGAAGAAMLLRGHRLRADETSMIGWCITNARARIALEAGADQVRQATVELPETRSEAAIPLRSRGRVLGAISVQSSQAQAFDEQAIAVLQTMADQIAVALDNARLFSQSQESLEAAHKAYSAISRQAWQDYLGSQASLGYLSNEKGILSAGDDWQPEVEAALQKGELVYGEQAVRTGGNGSHAKAVSRNTLAVPIKVRGQVVGVLDTYKSGETGEWSEEEVLLIQTLTEQLSVALDSARLYAETQQQAERERMVAEITGRMRETLEIDTVLRTAAQEIFQALGLHDVVITLEKPE